MYLLRVSDDIRMVIEKIQTDYQYDIVCNDKLRPDYRIGLIMDTNRIGRRLQKLVDEIKDEVHQLGIPK